MIFLSKNRLSLKKHGKCKIEKKKRLSDVFQPNTPRKILNRGMNSKYNNVKKRLLDKMLVKNID